MTGTTGDEALGTGPGAVDSEALPLTERNYPDSRGIDGLSARGVCDVIHAADRATIDAVGAALDGIARLIDAIVRAFESGGRLVYAGAGTSGRLGVLDASECPPTFGVAADLVQAVIAGGDRALRRSVEGAEDSAAAGRRALCELEVSATDVVCAIAASGSTPFVFGALEAASSAGATTALITCNPDWADAHSAGARRVDHAIVLAVGPEVIAGSSRLKAGTATKMALNMITTGAMVRWGKVYDNLMIDVTPTNDKLRRRATRLVSGLGEVTARRALELLERSDWEVKAAIVMARLDVALDAARQRLRESGGRLRSVIGPPRG